VNVDTIDYGRPDAPHRFGQSLRETGFAVLVRHPLPTDLVRRVQEEWLAWFRSGAKLGYLPEPGGQDGYHPQTGSETAVGATVADVKEFYRWYPWGRQPEGLSEAAAELYRAAADLGATLLGWLGDQTPPEVASRLSMPLPQMVSGSRRTLLRILHYPPLTGSEPPGAMRAAAHEDINLLTVLPAATRPGLQLLDTAGTWHDVPCDPASVVINSGDMLALASGGHYPSTTHRVLLPEGEEARRPRVATPLFLHAADDVELGGRTAFDFLRDRLQQIWGVTLEPRVTSARIGASGVEPPESNLAAPDRIDFEPAEPGEIDRYATEGGINIWARSSAG
jgi:isopenicillin N synthase-like dioxygenase